MAAGKAPLSEGASSRDEALLEEAIAALASSPTRRSVLKAARKRGDLASIIQWGNVSRTDALLTRHFQPESGEERRSRRVTVILRRGQGFTDLVLDLAHELTHASAGATWDASKAPHRC